MKISFDFGSLIGSAVGIAIGFSVVFRRIESYNNARYGFHKNLKNYILRLKHLIQDSEQPNKPFFSVWYNLSENQNTKIIIHEHGVAAQKLSTSFMEFLCTANNQINPKNTTEKEWDENIGKLLAFLRDFSYIGSKITFPCYNTDEDIDEKFKELLSLLEWIENRIQLPLLQTQNNQIINNILPSNIHHI